VTRERIFTTQEPRRLNGENKPAYTAYQGVVDDGSDCPSWRSDLYEHPNLPEQDLTSELTEAPHQTEVFTRPCIRRVGRLFLG
jgi:predicted heme/steroid binding protein